MVVVVVVMMMMVMTTIHHWHRGLGVGSWVLLLLLLMLLMTMTMVVVVVMMMMMMIMMMMMMTTTTTIHPGLWHRVSGSGRLGAAVPGRGQGSDPAGRGHQRAGPSAELRHPPHNFRLRPLRAGHSGMLRRQQRPTVPAGLGGRLLLFIVGAIVVGGVVGGGGGGGGVGFSLLLMIWGYVRR